MSTTLLGGGLRAGPLPPRSRPKLHTDHVVKQIAKRVEHPRDGGISCSLPKQCLSLHAMQRSDSVTA
jgi:hypothetical protein